MSVKLSQSAENSKLNIPAHQLAFPRNFPKCPLGHGFMVPPTGRRRSYYCLDCSSRSPLDIDAVERATMTAQNRHTARDHHYHVAQLPEDQFSTLLEASR